MALIRTFVAVEFSDQLKEEIALIQKDLRSKLDQMKWVPRSNFHLTLKFLGDVEARRIEELAHRLRRAVQGREAFTLNLAGVGGFPRVDHPKVVWLGVEQGKRELIQLQKVVEAELAVQGFPPEKRSYSPHLTLARSRDYTDLTAVGEALKCFPAPATAGETVQAIRIMKSDLRPGGPVYTCLEEIEF